MPRVGIFACLLLIFAATPSQAVELGDQDQWYSLEIHGFATQGAFITTPGVNFLSVNSNHGSVEFSEVGLNATKQVTDKLRFGLQLFAQRIGADDDFVTYSVKADWFYLDYHFRDWLGLRVGRTKLPFGLYNDTSDIDAARVPILLPQAAYPLSNREVLLAQTGAELYGYKTIGPVGALEYRLYGGTIFVDNPPTVGAPYQIKSASVPYIFGGRLVWETPLQGLRFAGSLQTLRLDTQLQFATTPPTNIKVDIPYTLWMASIEYVHDDLLLAVEYGEWAAQSDSSNPALFPHLVIKNQRGYVMASYRIFSWLHPGVYYSVLFPTDGQYKTRADEQLDLAGTLRFDIIANHWIAKLEGHFMAGTASIDPSINANKALTVMPARWGLFMATTTVYF